MLSPYIARRMITENEVLGAVLARHSAQVAEKFIQEVFWRSYWKGWLEMRPAVWAHYRAQRNLLLADPPPGYLAATLGRTGIEGFDDWARDLVATGWLHNHARMWFASIWIFTLKLPWELGADFFLRHLVDGDAASNTLSWRWVAGLHTQGKTYLARADNIEKYTQGRFRPKGLAETAPPVIESQVIPVPVPARMGHDRLPTGRYALLLSGEDLHPQSLPGYEANPPEAVIVPAPVPVSVDHAGGDAARRFSSMAMQDALARLGLPVVAIEADWSGLEAALSRTGCEVVASSRVCSGPMGDFITSSRVKLAARGVTLHEVSRSFDRHAWPLASAGFFKLKAKIPALLSRAGLTAS